jgi:hypothetical protein
MGPGDSFQSTAASPAPHSFDRLGDLDTLAGRLQAEVVKSNTVVTWQALVGARSRGA